MVCIVPKGVERKKKKFKEQQGTSVILSAEKLSDRSPTPFSSKKSSLCVRMQKNKILVCGCQSVSVNADDDRQTQERERKKKGSNSKSASFGDTNIEKRKSALVFLFVLFDNFFML